LRSLLSAVLLDRLNLRPPAAEQLALVEISDASGAIHAAAGASDDGLLAFKRRAGRMDATAGYAGVITDSDQHAALITSWQVRSNTVPRWFQAYRQSVVDIPHAAKRSLRIV